MRYSEVIQGRFSNKNELLEFLKMVKLKEGKLGWALKQEAKKNKDLASICGIGVRRFQQIKAEYRMTGAIPKLVKARRPRTGLLETDRELIDKALRESRLCGAVSIRLYISKYYGRDIPYGKVHKHLLAKGISHEDLKKKAQRKYRLYIRDHTFSLVHLDWHESKAFPGKQVCVVEDDASRMLLCGGEFDSATAEASMQLMDKAIEAAESYSSSIREANTDRGSQFYANKFGKDGVRGFSEFEKFLVLRGIRHIPSRRNHPQTNGKNERWFRTYEENREKFGSFNEFMEWYNNRIHLGLSRKIGITPIEAALFSLQSGSLLGLFYRRFG